MNASESTQVVIDDLSYVPQIAVRVNKQALPAATLADVKELKVSLQADEPGGFSMTLSNHFTILEQAEQGKPLRKFQHSDDDTLDVFDHVTIEMGYAGRMRTLFVGEILTLQPAYPSGAVPTLTISGADFLNRLRLEKPGADKTKAFPNVPDYQIVERVARRHNLTLSTDSDRTGSPTPKPAMQRDMDDLRFVLFLAKRNDYECSVVIEPSGEPALYFGPPRDKRDGAAIRQLGLTWGESLSSFTPKLRVGRQVSKVTVRGWNPKTKEPIEYTAELKDLPKSGGNGKTGPELRAEKLGAKEYRVVDRPVHSADEAKRIAIQILTESANQFLTGSGEAIGEPLLVPQVNLQLAGLGTRFDGSYYVTKSDHSFGAGGYMTAFEVERREATEPKEAG